MYGQWLSHVDQVIPWKSNVFITYYAEHNSNSRTNITLNLRHTAMVKESLAPLLLVLSPISIFERLDFGATVLSPSAPSMVLASAGPSMVLGSAVWPALEACEALGRSYDLAKISKFCFKLVVMIKHASQHFECNPKGDTIIRQFRHWLALVAL